MQIVSRFCHVSKFQTPDFLHYNAVKSLSTHYSNKVFIISPKCIFSVCVIANSMQSENRLRSPRCRHTANLTKQTRHPWFWPIRSIMWKYDVNHITGSTQHIALSSEEDRATATGNMYRQFGEIWRCAWFLRYASRQTGIQTRWSQYFAPLPGSM